MEVEHSLERGDKSIEAKLLEVLRALEEIYQRQIDVLKEYRDEDNSAHYEECIVCAKAIEVHETLLPQIAYLIKKGIRAKDNFSNSNPALAYGIYVYDKITGDMKMDYTESREAIRKLFQIPNASEYQLSYALTTVILDIVREYTTRENEGAEG